MRFEINFFGSLISTTFYKLFIYLFFFKSSFTETVAYVRVNKLRILFVRLDLIPSLDHPDMSKVRPSCKMRLVLKSTLARSLCHKINNTKTITVQEMSGWMVGFDTFSCHHIWSFLQKVWTPLSFAGPLIVLRWNAEQSCVFLEMNQSINQSIRRPAL